MNHEIKFRGLTKDGQWVYGYYLEVGGDSFIVEEPTPMTMGLIGEYLPREHMLKVLPETVGQYTGLKDKNGNPLDWWAGDLFDDGGNLKTIVFRDGAFWLVWVKYPTHKQLLRDVIEYADALTKIGNIHEHKELLEAKP